MTNDEIIEIADDMLGYSDFGNYYGDVDEILEFADKIIKKTIENHLKGKNHEEDCPAIDGFGCRCGEVSNCNQT
jgi:hypothetical protein